ncbi:DNA repair Rad51-like protein [Encephalitozoon hellem ATCC 50504]|uniref:DNA repair and recombination protein RadA n=1 Tax=Encephalitozoon hellem TaxID=27973 RepID=A0A9Q9FB40_ENCHE|nr:DNA repair Rad51-like protein [Encephalitozoon hellem ATCC 50504]AFM98001.1 DNA repair Rad51-like protein [Encephalitozoon hellem ATCC 50504]UTX42805.1 DNA repair and recombination protein RadA [Encephalitozoon hellem]WEL38264.1 DNA repair and recombination protein RadA [Encephalitozoon hellem]|eukprot:XP_003886982.1 DNA repair Rad51-like protein [Encephalitozoon hellem ATCC 50504]
MGMLKYCGVTELSGKPGTGKTAIAIEESKELATIYITTTTFCIERYKGTSKEVMDRIIVKYIPGIEYLASFVMNSMERIIIEMGVRLVIIDSLDHLLATEGAGMDRRILFGIVNRLKRMNQKHEVNILVVTYHHGNWTVGTFCIPNPMLGLQWMYMVNTRYICCRDGDKRILRLARSPSMESRAWEFEIGSSAVLIASEIVEQQETF